MTDSGSDDPVADALVDGSVYERVRIQRMSTFDQQIPRKLHRFGWLLYLLAAALLSVTVLPPATEATLPVDPLATSTKVLVLGLIGGSVVVAMGVGLILNALAAERLKPMSESTAESLLALEEMASLIGFVIGGAVTLLTVGIVAVAHGGPEAVEMLLAVTRTSPYAAAPVPFPVTPTSAGVTAWVGGLGLHLAGVLIDPASGRR